jgi:hypothetical protein
MRQRTVIPPFYIILSLIIFIGRLNAQLPKGQEYSPLSCGFQQSEIFTEDASAITNVLYVKNVNGITREFYLEITSPLGWKTLNSSGRIYKLEPNDSLFIPIRIIPNKALMKGSTKYNINVFVVGTDGRAHAMCSFFAGRPKRTAWEMAILPRSRIYFLNDKYTVPLSMYIANKGEEPQDLNLSWNILGRGLYLRTDSLSYNNYTDLKIENDKDTVINFTADITKPDLNFSRIDIDNYKPNTDYEGYKYSIYFKAVEPYFRKGKGEKDPTPLGFQEGKNNNYRPSTGGNIKTANADLIKLNSSVDFVKLSNTAMLNSNVSGIIPVIWNSMLTNVLGMQPMWGNNFTTRFSPRKNAMLIGNLQHFFTYYSPGKNTYQNLQSNIAYFSPKLDLLFGQGANLRDQLILSVGTLMGNGNGLAVTYRPIKLISISSFYNQSPTLFSFNPTKNAFGSSVNYSSASKKISASLGYMQNNSFNTAVIQRSIATGFRWKINNNHMVRGSIGYELRQDSTGTAAQINRQAINWIANYNGSFFNKRLHENISALSRTFFNSYSALTNSLFIQNRTMWRADNWLLQLSSGLRRNRIISPNSSYGMLQIPSNLSFNINNSLKINLFPNIYHNYITDSLARMHQIGLSLNNSYFDINKNIRTAINMMGGYNFYQDSIKYKPIFNANVFLMAGYKTFSTNIRYTYGPMDFTGVRRILTNSSRYPQFIFINMNKQHIFRKIRSFVFDFSFNYSWNNVTFAHNAAISPVVYFFSRNGWRFNASFFYNLNARNPELAQSFYTYQGTGIPLPEPEPGVKYASNFNMQFGLRKEFGILLPKKMRKNFYINPTFIAFLDFNGNKIKDPDEIPLENMVIQLNGHEAITNKEGKCQFLNVEQKRYFFNVIPLVDLGGWFTIKTDSIDITPNNVYYLPFTKGVKITGTVLLDREKFSEDIIADLDLSKIRIFTTDTSANTYSTLTDRQGNFSFYVPYGFYALSMDEEVLSDRFFIAQNNIPIELEEGLENFYQAFFIIEKRRKVKKKKFNAKGELVFVEEVENDDSRAKKGKAKNKNEELGIFKEERRDPMKKDSTEIWKMNYEELDKRIQKLDSIISDIKSRSLLTDNGAKNTQFNQLVLIDALKKLKEEEERNVAYYIVQVAQYAKGLQPPSDIRDKMNNGSINTEIAGNGNTIYYYGGKFTEVTKANEALIDAENKKVGAPVIMVLYQNKVLTLNEFKNIRK